MNVLGIVSEYNPFHKGHKFHIDESKRIASADAVICAMSGNFVQRGEPACLDKWTRAKNALENGVDVVLEIPVYYCLGNASTYAVAGVSMLEAFGNVTHLSFGSESGDIETIKRVASNLNSDSGKMAALIRENMKEGMSYPSAREAAYVGLHISDDTIEDDITILRGSNDILAIEYMRALTYLNPVTVKRVGAGYNDTGENPTDFRSASYIRKAVAEGRSVDLFIPPGSSTKGFYEYGEKWFDIIRYKILTTDPETIEQAPHGGEGIANRLKEVALKASNIDEMILYTKSKRYTYTHVARLVLEVLLNIDRNDCYPMKPSYLRVLGFTERGRQLLSDVKRNELTRLPIITNLNKDKALKEDSIKKSLDLDVLASDVYNLAIGRSLYANSDMTTAPVIIEKTR